MPRKKTIIHIDYDRKMEQNNPLVSVVIPAYNAEKFIHQTISSVLEQTFPGQIEILVVDDASADGTEAVVRAIQPENNRVLRYFKNEENKGVAATRNYGVQQAGGDYVAFLDADDWWTKDKIEKQLQLLEQSQEEYCFCFSGRELMNAEGKSLGKTIPAPERVTFQKMLRTDYVTCSSVLIKRELALAYPMEYDQFCEDYICWMRILKDHGAAAGINEPLVKYRIVAGSKSNNKLKQAAMHYRSLRIIGLGPIQAAFRMVSYTYNGIKKYYI